MDAACPRARQIDWCPTRRQRPALIIRDTSRVIRVPTLDASVFEAIERDPGALPGAVAVLLATLAAAAGGGRRGFTVSTLVIVAAIALVSCSGPSSRGPARSTGLLTPAAADIS